DWISTGTYEAISKQLFQRAANYDTFLLEYDDERSGSFSALGDVPDDKTVVLGLVSTKFDRMEPADQLAARISEASGFFPLDHLAVGPGRQQVEGGVVGGAEEVEGQACQHQVLEPARRAQRDLRAGHGDVVERHAHGSRRGVQGVAPLFQLGAHRLVALVHPG